MAVNINIYMQMKLYHCLDSIEIINDLYIYIYIYIHYDKIQINVLVYKHRQCDYVVIATFRDFVIKYYFVIKINASLLSNTIIFVLPI